MTTNRQGILAGIVALSLPAGGCAFETAETALNACRMRWLEVIKTDFPATVNQRDIQYMTACMGSRGFRYIQLERYYYGIEVTSSTTYERRWL